MRVLVTGGGGFLGQAVVRRLLDRGDDVAVLNRGAYPDLVALGVTVHRGDIADAAAVDAAAAGADAVIHVAARAGPGLYAPDFEAANITGTGNIIAACRRYGIGVLVHTSSPSVVHHGGDLEGVDESCPIPAHFPAPYPATKAEAEKRVLAASGDGLRTCALRPHLIWGPGDNHLLPRLVARARRGRLRLPAPDKLIDTTYIDNAAAAHLLALDDLRSVGRSAGRAYFISNGEPRPVARILGDLLAAAGVEPAIGRVSPRVARAAAGAVEAVWRLGRLRSDPPLSRFVIEHLSTAHWYDLSAARRDLGYEPAIGLDTGLERLAAAWC